MTISHPPDRARFARARGMLRQLYHGQSLMAVRFQRAVLIVDLAIIAFFIAGPLLRGRESYIWVDIAVAILLTADIAARSLASTDLWRWLRQPATLVDLIVLVTLLLPTWLSNFGFLRILRLWTLSRSGFLWRPLRKHGLAQWEETGRAVVNLLTFLFIMTSFVFTFFAGEHTGIAGYVDALYFTVTSVTTTGYGDIVLPGTWGKLVSILVMIIGISLFVRLAQAIVRPNKVFFPCPQCGLNRHEPDAVHCKACPACPSVIARSTAMGVSRLTGRNSDAINTKVRSDIQITALQDVVLGAAAIAAVGAVSILILRRSRGADGAPTAEIASQSN